MRLAGSDSWRLERRAGQSALHAALRVRDAAGLVISPSTENPPPLATEVARLPDSLTRQERMRVGRDWASWWHELVDLQAHEAQRRDRPTGTEDMMAWMRARHQRELELFDPPDFQALAGRPQLRSVVRTVWAEYTSRPRPGPPDAVRKPQGFRWELTRDVVTSVAAERGVPVGTLEASTDVLDVEGMWSYLAGPGYGLCSPAVVADEAAATSLLRELFGSCVS